jgi:glycosyltransferase involved in cell wall biosynthesis
MSPAPRVAFFVPRLAGGGAERVVLTLAGAMAKGEAAVDLLLAERRGPLDDRVPPGVRVVSAGRASTAAALPAVARYLAEEAPDVLLTSLFGASAVGAAAARLAGTATKVAHVVHSLPTLKAQEATRPRARLLMAALPAVLRSADAVVAVSEAVADDTAAFSGRPRDRIEAIANPVEIDRVRAAADAPAAHAWLGGGAPVVVSVGRLHPKKGHALLLRAVARLRDRQVRCIILGEGPERERLEGLARRLGIDGRVDLPGFVANPHAVVGRADALALPSRREPFGLVLVEALACGTPVVAADAPGGASEILIDRDGAAYGTLAPRRPRPFARAVARVLDGPPDPDRLQARARRFRAERAVAGYRRLVRRLVRRRAAPPEPGGRGR